VHRWIDHTSELELELEAPNEEGIFEAGFEAMRELLASEGGDPARSRQVVLSADDRPALLADWLAELAYLAEAEGLVPDRLAALELEPGRVRAEVEGRLGRPPQLVKGVTYHRLALEATEAGYRATVVLDV
jgi:SHS2 domain-containing protein